MPGKRSILAIGWVIFVAYAYPGLCTEDTLDQLAQARAGFYLDDHPPVMAVLWSVIDWFIAGTAGMLFLQSAMFLVGTYLVLRRALSERGAAVTACAILLFPPVIAPMAVVWKDCLMAGALVLGAGLILDDRVGRRSAGLALLGLGTAVRYNAFAATLPLIGLLWLRAATVPLTWKLRLRRAGIAFGVWLAVTVSAFGANALVTDRKMYFWHSSLAVMDITGTLELSATPVTDSTLRRTLAGTGLRIDHDIHAYIHQHYRAGDFIHFVYGPDAMFDLPLVNVTGPAPPAQRAAIERAWRTIVLGRPIAYVKYRLDTFRVVIGLDDAAWGRVLVVTHDFQDKPRLQQMGIPTGYSAFQNVTGRAVGWLSHTVLFRPWAWLLLALALFVMARKERVIAGLLLSGLLLELSLLPLAGSPDFRYSHWMIVCTAIGGAMLLVRRMHAGRS